MAVKPLGFLRTFGTAAAGAAGAGTGIATPPTKTLGSKDAGPSETMTCQAVAEMEETSREEDLEPFLLEITGGTIKGIFMR